MSYFHVLLLSVAVCYTRVVDSFLVQRPLLPHRTKPQRSTSTFLLQAHLHWQSHVSTHPDGFNAIKQLWSDVTHKQELDLAFLFVGQAHASDFEELVQHARLQLSGGTGSARRIRLISLLGGGVIGENMELDEMARPSMSLLIGSLPEGSEVDVVEYSNEEGETKDNLQFEDRFTSCLVFGDPWAPVERMISALASTNRVLAGGISCPFLADQSSLAIDNRCLPQGSMIGVGFAGTLGLQSMVAQGCRPVGSIFRITESDGNIITKLDNKPALEVLQEVANKAPPEEQEQIESGLLCGISSNKGDDETPDFLSRQIMGFVPSVQGIAIGTNQIQTGDLFCFQVRDGTTAQQDLQLMVQRAKTARLFYNAASASKGTPVAAVQISCVARGRGMFDGVPNVDLSKVKQLVDDTPVVGGFFANGEIGPVGLAGFSTTFDGQSYLHSFTTVAAILCEYSKPLNEDSVEQESSLDAWG